MRVVTRDLSLALPRECYARVRAAPPRTELCAPRRAPPDAGPVVAVHYHETEHPLLDNVLADVARTLGFS